MTCLVHEYTQAARSGNNIASIHNQTSYFTNIANASPIALIVMLFGVQCCCGGCGSTI